MTTGPGQQDKINERKWTDDAGTLGGVCMTTRRGVGGVTETPKQTVSDKGFPAGRNSGTRVNSATGTGYC